jgi:hypothetical protein
VIFGLLRLLLAFLVVYVVLTIARGLLVGLGLIRRSRKATDERQSPRWQKRNVKPKENYTDVQEAKFKDISK